MIVNILCVCACIGTAGAVDAFANDEAIEFGRTATTRGLALRRRVDMKSIRPKSSKSSMSKGMSMFMSRQSKGKRSVMKESMMDEYV